MWDEVRNRPKTHGFEPKAALVWLADLSTEEMVREAEEQWRQAVSLAPSLKVLERTVQSGPWHCEGLFVSDHVKRMIVGLQAIADGASLLMIEEMLSEKHRRPEVIKLEETIRENAATLTAYALLHDLGKGNTIHLDAKPNTRGMQEGFSQHKYRTSKKPTMAEVDHYLKLFRAHELATSLNGAEAMSSFFQEFGIEVHYFGHPRMALSPQFDHDRQAIEAHLRLTPVDANKLAYIIENHIDAMSLFGQSGGAVAYLTLEARAAKMGLDAADAIDLLVAGVFLDSTIGSIACKNGHLLTDVTPVLSLWSAEEQSAPKRREARRAEILQRSRRKMKDLLKESELGANDVFHLLDVRVGRERKAIIQEVEELVKNPSLELSERFKNDEFLRRLKVARKAFDGLRGEWENGQI